MAVINLKALVLRGVSVLVDGKTVDTRLGFGYPTESQLPEIPISMRHGNCRTSLPEPQEWHPPIAERNPDVVVNATLRAGRSVSRTGVLSPATPPFGGRSLTTRGTWADRRGASQTAAARLDRKPVSAVASVALHRSSIGAARCQFAGQQPVAI